MCDYFLQRMDGQVGDLTDVVRAGGAMQAGVVADLSSSTATTAGWQLPPSADPGTTGLFPPPQPPSPPSDGGAGPSGADAFVGDAFAGLSDACFGTGGAAGFFDFEQAPVVGGRGCSSGGGALVDSGGALARGMMQMPALSPREIRPFPAMMAGGDMVKLGVPTIMPGLAVGAPPCAFDAAVAGMQMMPSPHAGGIKRRKNQARKVVCIPAPAASAGGRTTGEVVPSDLWAWRKYGQKPIKGSPYPRGYYRCSSSKGCPARKQVERSRTDPTLLVITYNSEHNHPWPTQRNALAGSTRSHHAKNSKNNSSPHDLQKPIVKAELDQTPAVASGATTATGATSTTTTATTSTASNSTPTTTMAVKEEAMVVGSEMEKGGTSVSLDHGDLMQQMFSQSYRPMIPEGGHHVDDFFADLAELESDPMSLIFPGGGDPGREKQATLLPKGLLGADPLFNMLDWGTTNVVATSAGSSFEQGESGL